MAIARTLPMNPVTIRSATEADLPEILQIYNEAILNTTAVYDYEPHTLAMRQHWFRAKQADNFPVLVADSQNAVLGFAALGLFRAWEAYRYTVENSIYVAPNHRGKGIGKQLLQALIHAAQTREFHVIVAGIDAENAISIQLHEQLGFRKVAHFQQVGYKFNRWLDLVFMQRILESASQQR